MRWLSYWRSRTLALAVLCLAPLSCVTKYSEPPGSQKDVAFLESTSPTWIVSIDGKKVSNYSLDGVKHLKVFPGNHWVEVKYSLFKHRTYIGWDHRVYTGTYHAGSRQNVMLQLKAEAGHNYYVKDGRRGDLWEPHISELRDPVFLDLPTR